MADKNSFGVTFKLFKSYMTHPTPSKSRAAFLLTSLCYKTATDRSHFSDMSRKLRNISKLSSRIPTLSNKIKDESF